MDVSHRTRVTQKYVSRTPRRARRARGLTTLRRRNQPVTARLGATREIRTFFTDRAATVDPLSAVVVIAQRPRERRMVQV